MEQRQDSLVCIVMIDVVIGLQFVNALHQQNECIRREHSCAK